MTKQFVRVVTDVYFECTYEIYYSSTGRVVDTFDASNSALAQRQYTEYIENYKSESNKSFANQQFQVDGENNVKVENIDDLKLRRKDENPIYRVYVNGELFGERKWRTPDDQYLEEIIQIAGEPGDYVIEYKLVVPKTARLKVENYRVDQGPGRITGNKVRIYNNKFSTLRKNNES